MAMKRKSSDSSSSAENPMKSSASLFFEGSRLAVPSPIITRSSSQEATLCFDVALIASQSVDISPKSVFEFETSSSPNSKSPSSGSGHGDSALAMAKPKNADVFRESVVLEALEMARGVCGEAELEKCLEGAAMAVAMAGASGDVVAATVLYEVLALRSSHGAAAAADADADADADAADPDAAAAAATEVQMAVIRRRLGSRVANLVNGVSELAKLSQILQENHHNNKDASPLLQPDHLLITLLTMVDVRVIFIKLAHRLQTMRKLMNHFLPASSCPQDGGGGGGRMAESPQDGGCGGRIAAETLGIFAPLASRLGIWSWEVELEDLSFMYLYPEEHERIRKELNQGMQVSSSLKKLNDTLRNAGIGFHDLSGRSKSLYSIYTKMSRKSRSLTEIFDIRGLRVILSDIPTCFLVLHLVHQLWPPISGKQKDYINHPKHNGYQSLHTVVMVEDGFPLEVQIRTLEMHHNAEFGMAAHWRYKQGDTPQCSSSSSLLAHRIEWARWVLSWQTAVVDSKLRASAFGVVDVRPSPCPLLSHLTEHGSCSLEYGKQHLISDIFMDKDKMAMQFAELPLTSTAHEILARVRMAAHEGNSGLSCWRDAQVETGNHRTTVVVDNNNNLGLRLGLDEDEEEDEDHMVEFKPFDQYRECIYGGT